MAKSKRSKWKRKMRAVKRKKHEGKELIRLKKVLGEDKNIDLIHDIAMSDLVTVTDVSTRKDVEASKGAAVCTSPGEVTSMEVVGQPSKYSVRTLRDEHGQYPVWMNQRAIQKRKKASVTVRKAKVTKKHGKNVKAVKR
jgi:hypothetical protein